MVHGLQHCRICSSYVRHVPRQVKEAHGRYIVSQSGLYSPKFIAEVLSKRFPQYKFNATKDASPMKGFDTTKVRDVNVLLCAVACQASIMLLSCGLHAC